VSFPNRPAVKHQASLKLQKPVPFYKRTGNFKNVLFFFKYGYMIEKPQNMYQNITYSEEENS